MVISTNHDNKFGPGNRRDLFYASFTFLDHLYLAEKQKINLRDCCIFKATLNHNSVDDLPRASSPCITNNRVQPSTSLDTTDHNVCN